MFGTQAELGLGRRAPDREREREEKDRTIEGKRFKTAEGGTGLGNPRAPPDA